MEMEGRGATKQARGSSAGSSASSEVSGEPVLAGEDEEASVVAESPHPDDEGRPRKDKRKRAPAAAPPPQPPWPPPPPPPQRPDGYVHPRYEGELNRDLVGSAGGKLHEFADACRKFSAGSTFMDDVLITYWRELGRCGPTGG